MSPTFPTGWDAAKSGCADLGLDIASAGDAAEVDNLAKMLGDRKEILYLSWHLYIFAC